MAKRLQFRRLLWLALLLCVAFAGLGYRLVDLQVLRHRELSEQALRNTQREQLLAPRRGDILDARGNILATSILVKTVCANPSLIGTQQVVMAHALSPLLGTNEAALIKSLTPRVWTNDNGQLTTNKFCVLKRKVPVETWEKIQAAMTNFTFAADEKKLPKTQRAYFNDLRRVGVFARDDQLRVYPSQNLAAHVLGFIKSEEKELDGIPVSTMAGVDGIEKKLDSQLAGVCGWRVTEMDHKARELVTLREQDVEPRDGLNAVLTIDSMIQHIVESALAEAMEKHSPISISGVVVRPRTGEILAMATLPNYDPNNPGKATDDERRNRVITDVAEPGSTFKIVVVSAALNDGTVSLNDVFDCEHSHWFYAGRTLHDHESYGPLSVERIITKSSNIGAGKIGVKMGESRLYEYLRNYGFGTATGVPLPAEVNGLVRPLKQWSKVSIAQIPMGQGIAVTRMQMVMAMCAIANQGWLMRPMLIDRLEDEHHNVVAKCSPQKVRQVIGKSADELMIQALKTVVSPEGTAPKAALEHYTVAGKTGTANKVENGQYVRKFFSSFIGFFPADNPELCISVTMDEPKQGYFGGQIAAPVFKQIAERAANYLNIKPEDTPPIPDNLASPGEAQTIKTASARPER
jgi:cell division protein FtsI/penicillin-binding protein 2